MSDSPPSPLVEIRRLNFGYSDTLVLKDLSLTVPRGKVTALMGPMGGGKTTTLRVIGGECRASAGQMLFDGQDITGMDRAQIYAVRRRMGVMFQFGALFADLDVFDNVAFPLREHSGLPEALIRHIVLMKLDAVGLRGARGLMPSEVSGGMARRIALARAIALDPELVMVDEPFSGLDPISLRATARLIRQLTDSMGLTCILVSHEVTETLAIADHVILLDRGQVVEQGPVEAIRRSANPLVHQYIHALPDGPVGFHYPGQPLAADFGLARAP